MTIPHANYIAYKKSIQQQERELIKEDKQYCYKLLDALHQCKEKNGNKFLKCERLDHFISNIHCYSPV